MRWVTACLVAFVAYSFALGGDRREFEGSVDAASPSSASVGIEKVYAMFSRSQLNEIRKDPTAIMQYRLPDWIEGKWLAKEDDPLYVWFKAHGIEIRSSMSLFIVRGFQFKLCGKKYNIQKELKRPGWQLRPPPPPPHPPSLVPPVTSPDL
ncbi:hypothetical protein [Mesoterricola sediminis]|uniref:hypothetical protein n=1 Tax=Mesoterricola sediminis TaxID=2927980 RepID=UPI0029302B10|nr:hypothetical protein [Mesoterricola sediminis]